MTDTTDTAALTQRDKDRLGFVTDDNTGGYYVAECEECGQIFPSQTCDGAEQIADSGDYGDCYCPHCGFIDPLECDNANLVWNVQQLKIVNLTKQLEAERQRADNAHKYGSERDAENDSLMLTVGRLRVEIAALKGDQVPVGWRFEDCENEPCTNGAVVSVGTGSDNIHLCAECSRNDKYKRQRTVALSQRLPLKVTAPQKTAVLPGPIKISEVVAAVSLEQNRKWNGRVGYMAGWNACIDAAKLLGGEHG